MPAFLHAADVHLDSPLTGLEAYDSAPVEDIRAATRRALENLVALALAESVDALLLAGDIYDGDWRDYNTGLFFAGQMARLQQAGIPVLMIHGNHDAASQISRQLRLPKNVHVFSSRAPESHRIEAAGLVIHGQSYARRQTTEDLTRAYPAAEPGLFNIGLLHTSLDGRPGHDPYAPCRLDDLYRLGYDYWALGHVHQREIVHEESPWVVFPGNLQGRHARETGAKGATLVRIQDNRVLAVEHHPLDVVRWVQCDLELPHTITSDQIEARIATELQAAQAAAEGRLLAVRLRLHGTTRADTELRATAEALLNQCRVIGFEVAGRDLWIEKLILATRRPAHPLTATESAAQPDGSEDSALAPLFESLADPDSLLVPANDPPALATNLLEDIEALLHKLPATLHNDSNGLDLSAPSLTCHDGGLHQCLRDAHALLLERLRAGPSPQH
ncbi:metallophosphoesterase family protein [Rhabdochromatium marinum]|uniref:metallophosphoesterase family protein n=1 Tax=Rhabdochromatium marinum TaxID=48729 RepID=UPI001906203E|nr:DNA repair exonuclease [Rhabdochromatium marinum]MBK1648681.1 DNA repair exonuclease [Rhabdochromatium marinum]